MIAVCVEDEFGLNSQHSNDVRLQENVFWFEIAVDQPCLFEHGERVQELSGKYFHELRAQALILVLFDEFVQVRGEKLENEAEVVTVNK